MVRRDFCFCEALGRRFRIISDIKKMRTRSEVGIRTSVLTPRFEVLRLRETDAKVGLASGSR